MLSVFIFSKDALAFDRLLTKITTVEKPVDIIGA